MPRRSNSGSPAWLQGELLGAFCLTEPHVGSDASALRTTATKEGDSYVINGVKQFITSGKNGDVAIVIAVTDKGAGKKGMSAFFVPTTRPATWWRGSKTSWASTAATPRRSTSTTAASRPRT
jgi:alkylation response protein AidB-like acyl-CoA dehydrogenase